MKVLVFTQQFGTRWSGVGTYATNLVSGLVKRDVDVTVVCPTGMHGDVHGVRVLEVAIKGWEHKVNYWLPLAWRYATLLKTMPPGEGYDLVHFTDAREALFAPQGSLPLIGTVNDYYPATCPLNPFELKPHYAEWPARWVYWRGVRLLEPFAYGKLDAVVANTEFVARVIKDAYRLSPDRIEVINYGIDDENIDDSISLEGKPSMLFVGANFQRKGLPDIIRALQTVRDSMPEVLLHVVGSDTKADMIKQLAVELGVERNVKLLGGRPNEEVRRMKPDMFVMPSLIEGFGIVFLEAMLAGVPVIGGRTGGTVELIEDGKNGFTVEPGDTADLAKKILRLATEEKLRITFIREGRATASRYTTDRMVEKTLALYNKTAR